MRIALLLIVALIGVSAVTACAQAPDGMPYQRVRSGADSWQVRGGRWAHGPYGGYGGFYGGLYAPPLIVGSYYQRPYPYHFDYFRDRWAGPAYSGGVEPTLAAPDCPCVTPPPVEVVQ